MRRMTMISLVALGAASMTLGGMAIAPTPQHTHDDDDAPDVPVIVVSGEGRVSSTPDTVIVRLAGVARAATAGEAQGNVNESVDKALRDVRALRLEDLEMKTTQLSLNPIYDERRRGEVPRIVGYEANLGVEIRTTSIDKASEVIDKALEAGMNRFNGISFTLKSNKAARMEALAAAARDAKLKAGVLAEQLGVGLGSIERVQESVTGGAPRPLQMRGMEMMAMDAGVSTPVEAGSLETVANVTIIYEIRQ